MKNKYIIFLLAAFLFTGLSCKKALDMAPDGKITMDEIFSDNDKVGAFLNSCYANIPAYGVRYYFWCRGPVEWSDEAWDTDAEAEPTLMSGRMYNGDASAANHPAVNISADAGNGDYWARFWSAIRNCTIFINRIDDATVNKPADRSRWMAEAHLLRAFYYSELLKWYGAVLPIEQQSYTFSDDFSGVEKASYYDLVKFIMADCDTALATPELPWRITTNSEAGRVTKALAEAIKSRMILYAASPLNNAGK
ncbi:MAG TPA: RagB/SusD family nutrient uptake outer membrane protein, partial [Chitinophagaceae bacterium]|nr:RagB/SusD family nutrient uptake outer membrane protein [Chitinophagaceae bacterium]